MHTLDKKITLSVYFLLIVLATPFNLHWAVIATFWLFSAYLFWILEYKKGSKVQPLATGHWSLVNNIWLLLPLSVIVITRIIPFLHWGVANPLGADAFVYIKDFEECFALLKSGGCPRSVHALTSNLLYLFGWNTGYVVYLFYIILNVFVGLTIWLITKEYFGQKAAFFSFLLFSLSASQYLAYFAFYWKMMIAAGLTMVSFYLLSKKSWLVVPVAGFMGSLHLISFIPFALSLIPLIFFGKNKKFNFFAGLGILLITLSIKGEEYIGYLPFYAEYYGRIVSFVKGYSYDLKETLLGHFIDFSTYRGLVLIYLPLALITFVRLIKSKKNNYLVFYFLINLIMIVFHFIFQNRFIVLLDLTAIVFAGPILSEFTELFWREKIGKLIILIMFAGLLSGLYYQSWFVEPVANDSIIKYDPD